MKTFFYLITVLCSLMYTSVLWAEVRLTVGPTLGIMDSSRGYGAMINILRRSDPKSPLSYGIETGLVRWSESISVGGIAALGDIDVSISFNSFPVLGAVSFYPLGTSDRTVPYLGISMGPSFTLLTVSASAMGQKFNENQFKVYFEGLIKPGVEILNFFVEPKFGILKSEFIFLPTVGMIF